MAMCLENDAAKCKAAVQASSSTNNVLHDGTVKEKLKVLADKQPHDEGQIWGEGISSEQEMMVSGMAAT